MQSSVAIKLLLAQRKTDYLTVNQVRDSLPAATVKALGIKKRKTPAKEAVECFRPCLGEDLKITKKGHSYYVVRDIPIKELIINKIKDKPDLSSKRLGSLLPVSNVLYVTALNEMFQSGELVGVLNEKTHLIKRFVLQTNDDNPADFNFNENDGKNQFKKAYQRVAKGKSFVRIHLIRKELNWSESRFNRIIEQLKSDLVIQLQGGDTSAFTSKEIGQSYIDPNGRLRLTVTWISND